MATLRNVFVTATVTGVVLMGAACSSKGTDAVKKEGKVVAQVDDVTITTGELQEELDKLPPYLKGRVATAEGRREFLDNLLTRKALMLEADTLGIENDPQISRQIAEYKERLVLQKLMQDNIPKDPQLSDEEIRKYFDEHTDEFKEGAQVRVRHVLIKSEPGDPDAKKQEARRKAEQVRKRARGGEDFEKLAKQYSEDVGSKNRGGDLGFFPRGRMAKPFEDTAFALSKPNEISDVVETQFGYHVIQYVDRQEPKEKTFDEAKEQIRRRLAPQRQRDSYQTFITNIKDKRKIVVHDDVLASMGGDKSAEAPKAEPAAAEAEGAKAE